jgi:hypothetical protein
VNSAVFVSFQTNLPVFKVKESIVRRRYSDFEWLRNELERDSKVQRMRFSIFSFALYVLEHRFSSVCNIINVLMLVNLNRICHI